MDVVHLKIFKAWKTNNDHFKTGLMGLPWWLGFPHRAVGKSSACNAGDLGFNSWVGKISWRKKWQPTPVFLPGESRGQRSLAGTVHGITKVRLGLTTKTHTTHPRWLRLGASTAGGRELRSHTLHSAAKKPGLIMKMLGNNG